MAQKTSVVYSRNKGRVVAKELACSDEWGALHASEADMVANCE